MDVGSFGVLDMSRVYPKTLFGPMFYSWWNFPLETVMCEAAAFVNSCPFTVDNLNDPTSLASHLIPNNLLTHDQIMQNRFLVYPRTK